MMALRSAVFLAEQGEFQLDFIVGGDPFATRVAESGFTVRRIPMRDNADLLALWRLIRTLRQSRPDMVHLHMNRAGLLGGMAARWLKIPSLVTAAGMIHARYVRQADLILPCSHGVEKHLLDQGIAPQQMRLIRNAVPIPTTTDIVSSKEEEPRLVCVARLHPAKGHEDLLRVLSLLSLDYPHLILSFVGGGDQRLLSRLKSLARRLNLADRVEFHGDQPDISPWIRPGNIFLLASRREGLPLSVLEAMAAGMPAIAWNIPGLDEIGNDQAGPRLLPLGDLPRMAGCISQLLRHPALARRLGENNLKLVRERYSLERYCSELAECYRNLAGR